VPLILTPPHHISSPLDEQLILELIAIDEADDILLDPMERAQLGLYIVN
jgi:hypothetical protein